ncbi:hypothetical protein, partial [Xanthomonas oryzae]|uniref:hypothetical protein n=1 Tax=Xanthomonas oryzae TaxID=347 RepID=UPI001ED8F238
CAVEPVVEAKVLIACYGRVASVVRENPWKCAENGKNRGFEHAIRGPGRFFMSAGGVDQTFLSAAIVRRYGSILPASASRKIALKRREQESSR